MGKKTSVRVREATEMLKNRPRCHNSAESRLFIDKMERSTTSPAGRYRELIMRHRRMLRLLCLRRAHGDPSVADDFYQEVVLSLWRYLDGILTDVHPLQERVYVRRAALFALGHCTRGRKPDVERLEAEMTMALDELDRDNERFLDDLVAALPSESERQAVGLYRSGYSYDDIGLFLGISPNAVAQRIHRAVEHMRQIYEQEQRTIKTISNGTEEQ